MYYACSNGNISIVKFIMEQDFQEVDFSHTATLSASITFKRYKIVDMLVKDSRVPITEEV